MAVGFNGGDWYLTSYTGTVLSAAFWFYFTGVTGDGFQALLWLNAGSFDKFIELEESSLRISNCGNLHSQAIVYGNWYKCGVVFNGNSQMLWVAPDTGTLSTSITASVPSATFTELRFGVFGDNTEQMNGRLVNMKVWNAALTVSELNTEVNSYNVTRTSGLIRAHNWKTSSVTPNSGSGGNLTQTGTPFDAEGPSQLDAASGPPSGRMLIGYS